MREGFQGPDMTPHLGGTTQLPPVGTAGGAGGGGGHGRTQSLGVPRDRFVSTMEMGNVVSSSTREGGKEYERLPTQDRKE